LKIHNTSRHDTRRCHCCHVAIESATPRLDTYRERTGLATYGPPATYATRLAATLRYAAGGIAIAAAGQSRHSHEGHGTIRLAIVGCHGVAAVAEGCRSATLEGDMERHVIGRHTSCHVNTLIPSLLPLTISIFILLLYHYTLQPVITREVIIFTRRIDNDIGIILAPLAIDASHCRPVRCWRYIITLLRDMLRYGHAAAEWLKATYATLR